MTNNKPANKMQSILSSPDKNLMENKEKDDVFANIPKSNTPPASKTAPAQVPAPPAGTPPAPPKKDDGQAVQPEQPSRGEKTLRALWTITAVISMTVNVIVIIIVALLIQTYTKNAESFKLPPGISADTPNDFLQGLYDNFQLMDEAHIKTDIVVEDIIPVQFDLALNQQTDVILSEDVTIYGAYVVINTATININAPATVVLPKGTNLPIFLDLVVPVDTTIPVKLNVPVDIALEETDLHTPFDALKEVVRPLYCLVSPRATGLNGEVVCP